MLRFIPPPRCHYHKRAKSALSSRSWWQAILATGALLCGSLSAQADTLLSIYEQALANDATLKASEATYKANLEIEKQALSALLPQLSASASYSQTDLDTTADRIDFSSSGAVLDIPTRTNLDATSKDYGAVLEQSLIDIPLWFGFKSGQQTSKQAAAQFAYDQQDLILRVATAYFNVLQALDNLEASRAEERATKRQLEQTQQRFDVGLIAITDVYEAQASYDDTVVQVLIDEGEVGTNYQALTVLTGTMPGELWRLSKDFPVVNPDPLDRSAWVDFALENNYSLQAAYYAMRAAKENATAQKMEHLPKLTGAASYSDNDTNADVRYSRPFDAKLPQNSKSDGTVWSVNLSVPLYTGGFISSQRRQAYELYNVALQDHINTQRTVVQDTRASHITVLNDVQSVKARQQSIVSSSSALEATEAGYEVGTRNIVDVLQARQSLYDSIRDYSTDRYSYIIDYLTLKQAAGTLSPEDIFYINRWIVAPNSPDANPFSVYYQQP